MSSVVQARCPGCKNVLRIPASWVSQPIRCKHCGMIMQSRGAAAVPRPAGGTTPPPPTHRIPSTMPAPPAAASALPAAPPPTRPVPVVSPAPMAILAAPTAGAAPVAVPAVPVARPAQAIPVAPVALPAAAASTAWDGLDEYAAKGPGARRRKRSPWKGVAVFLTLLAISGTLTYFTWSKVASLLNDPQPDEGGPVAASSKNETRVATPPTPAGPGPDTPEVTTPPNAGTPTPAPPATGTPTRPRETPRTPPPPPAGSIAFPRRALVISVHNYLYANPIDPGLPVVGAFNVKGLLPALNKGLRIPMNQMAHLSDAATERDARPPLKGMIEQTLTGFLNSSRGQDRILVFFIGHSAVIDDEPYLVPIEGELDNAATLIPLKWVYEQLKSCKAAQKVLVLDVNRFNPVYGVERPNSGPMEDKFAEAIMNPPAGVQVWGACSKDQLSYATDNSPMGVFLEEMWETMAPPASRMGSNKTLSDGKIQRPDDPIPMDRFNELVNGWMQKRLEEEKLSQVAILGGTVMDNGVAYNPAEPAAPVPTLARVPEQNGGLAAIQLIRSVLDEVGTPPVKQTQVDNKLNYAMLPPFAAKLDDYNVPSEDSKVKQEIKKARAVLWAISPGDAPADMAAEVQAIREDLQVNLTVLKEGYRIPSAQAEARFKDMVFDDERQVAILLSALTEALERLESVKDEKEKEPKRWQANYDFTLARMQSQIAYLYEYQSMLGLMRKELPPNDPVKHSRWLLASSTSLQGDSTGRKLARFAKRTYETLAEEHAGTPWEVLAKREKLTALGLEWKASR